LEIYKLNELTAGCTISASGNIQFSSHFEKHETDKTCCRLWVIRFHLYLY